MRAGEIIAVGSEFFLNGQPETNSLFLTDRLASIGVDVRFKSLVGDDEAAMAEVLRAALDRSEVIVMTGGLGPTRDDRTRSVVARVLGTPLRRRREALALLRTRWAERGVDPSCLSAAQLRQAQIPAGAIVLQNPVGLAPGFLVAWDHRILAVLPGVPTEAREMFNTGVAPYLLREKTAAEVPLIRTLATFGLPESEVDRRLSDLGRTNRHVQVGLSTSPLGVTIRLVLPDTAGVRGPSGMRALDALVQTSRARLGDHVYAEGNDTMEQVIGRLLTAHRMSLSLAESCTGGLIGHRLTEVPGSSAYLDRGIVCYSNHAKIDLLNVSKRLLARRGAVSAEVAEAMARGVRRWTHDGLGLSVTGIAGPGGGTPLKPVGLVYIGLAWQGGCTSRAYQFHGDRASIKLRASQAALDLLRRWLTGRVDGS